jgi:hypothetical protein
MAGEQGALDGGGKTCSLDDHPGCRQTLCRQARVMAHDGCCRLTHAGAGHFCCKAVCRELATHRGFLAVGKGLATGQGLFFAQAAWMAGQISGDKGISQQLSLLRLSEANFRAAGHSPRIGAMRGQAIADKQYPRRVRDARPSSEPRLGMRD